MKHLFVKCVLLASITPLACLATENKQPLDLPRMMTPTGAKFARLCSDAAFVQVSDYAARQRRCERLLLEWQSEVERRQDTQVAADTGKPGFLNLRGIPPYPVSR